ncbi:MAG: PD-(D/E)XK nuclease family protein, partial [Thermoplasmata archaeon]
YLTSFGAVEKMREPLKLGTKLHLLLRNGAIDEEDERANELVSEIYNTEFWRVMTGSKNYRELPFLINIDETMIRGTIDLAYEHDGEWNIVDYKTNSTDIDLYRGQLLSYVLALYYLKSYSAKHIALYSINSKKLVSEPAPDIEHVESQIRNVIKNIEAEQFQKIKSKNCEICEFSELCKKEEP